MIEYYRHDFVHKTDLRKLVKEWRDRIPDSPLDGYEYGKKDAFDLCIYDVEKLIEGE